MPNQLILEYQEKRNYLYSIYVLILSDMKHNCNMLRRIYKPLLETSARAFFNAINQVEQLQG